MLPGNIGVTAEVTRASWCEVVAPKWACRSQSGPESPEVLLCLIAEPVRFLPRLTDDPISVGGGVYLRVVVDDPNPAVSSFSRACSQSLATCRAIDARRRSPVPSPQARTPEPGFGAGTPTPRACWRSRGDSSTSPRAAVIARGVAVATRATRSSTCRTGRPRWPRRGRPQSSRSCRDRGCPARCKTASSA